MKGKLTQIFRGETVKSRAMRGSVITFASVAGTNILRLGSNLLLTRLLFPEAFGIMALVQVFLGGLKMFSDIGINISILQNRRGDEETFLNTAWTMKCLRGVILWIGACLLAWPAAEIYDQPLLAQILPVAGLTAIFNGFESTNIATANRNLKLGRITALELGWQFIGIVISALLAYWLQSVWALVFGGLFMNFGKAVSSHFLLPGIRNRFHWDMTVARDVFGFGKYLFFSTVAGFIVNQGDKAVLGRFISMADLGIYNVGFFLGTIPLLVVRALSSKVIMPLFRMRPPAESPKNRKQILRARRSIVSVGLCLSAALMFSGPALINILYDDRYLMSGGITTLVAGAIIPQIVFGSYGAALLANGDSRRHFILLTTMATLQLITLLICVPRFGAIGAVIAPTIAALLVYPLRARFANIYAAEDRWGDMIYLALGLGLAVGACYLHQDHILAWLP